MPYPACPHRTSGGKGPCCRVIEFSSGKSTAIIISSRNQDLSIGQQSRRSLVSGCGHLTCRSKEPCGRVIQRCRVKRANSTPSSGNQDLSVWQKGRRVITPDYSHITRRFPYTW